MRYDRARGSLDRHATYIVAAYAAGAAGNRHRLEQLCLTVATVRQSSVADDPIGPHP